jgi:tripartite-type tricarboxylate transporter receptor subunit TctC
MKMRKGWTLLITGLLFFCVNGISSALAASDYPTRYIDLVIPYAPGGSTDFAPKLFKDKVEKILGQPLVFTYKPGASGALGTIYAKGSKPDGYTLLMGTVTTLALSQLTSKRPAEYTLDDFTPICNLTYVPLIFCVNQDSPYKTMADFIKAAKTKKMKYSTTGASTQGNIAMEALGRAAGFTAIHIPYSSGAAAVMTAVLGGHVDMSVSGAIGMERSANLRVLAVAQEKRWDIYPDVPTLKELGYPIRVELYYSLWAPKGIPKEIVDKIYAAFKKTLEENREEIIKIAEGANQILYLAGPEELLRVYRDQSEFLKRTLQK